MKTAATCSFIFIFLILPYSVFSQKTDRVLLQNNDWITGEIKKLDYGKLSLKTDAAGTIQIKWDQIYQIKSDKFFEIILSHGEKYFGSLSIPDDDARYRFIVTDKEKEEEIDMNRVVEIFPIKNRFWMRIDGNLDLGISYTKGSDVRQWNGSFKVTYRLTNSLTTLTGSSIYTAQPEQDPTSKQDLGLAYQYFTKNNFAYTAFTAAPQNSELGIESRVSFGLGYLKNWLRSNTHRFLTTLGCIVNQEVDADNAGKLVNIEGLVRLDYDIFKYSDPEIDVTAYFDFYPSFTVKNRYRTDSNIQIKYELFNDFYIGLTFYHNLDTKPPESAESSTDWGITSSIGYTF